MRIKGVLSLITCLALFACEGELYREELSSRREPEKSFTEFSSVEEVLGNTTSFADCLEQTEFETINSSTYEDWMASRQLCAVACEMSDDPKLCPDTYLNQDDELLSCEEYMEGTRRINEELNEKRKVLASECQKALFKGRDLGTQNVSQPTFPLSDCITYWLRFDDPKERLKEFTNCDVDTRYIKSGSFDDCLREDRSVLGGVEEHSKMMLICWQTIEDEEKSCRNLRELKPSDITDEDLAKLEQSCV